MGTQRTASELRIQLLEVNVQLLEVRKQPLELRKQPLELRVQPLELHLQPLELHLQLFELRKQLSELNRGLGTARNSSFYSFVFDLPGSPAFAFGEANPRLIISASVRGSRPRKFR